MPIVQTTNFSMSVVIHFIYKVFFFFISYIIFFLVFGKIYYEEIVRDYLYIPKGNKIHTSIMNIFFIGKSKIIKKYIKQSVIFVMLYLSDTLMQNNCDDFLHYVYLLYRMESNNIFQESVKLDILSKQT